MRKNKRVLAAVLAASLCLGSVTGCSTRNDDNESTKEVIVYPTEDYTETETDESSLPESTEEVTTEKVTETEEITETDTEEDTEDITTEDESEEPTEKGTSSNYPETTEDPFDRPTSPEIETTTTSDVGLTAVARVENYVNVRSGPSTTTDIIGKIYNNCAATILSETECNDGKWYYMSSGNVTGYIKAEFFIVGDEAEALREEIGITKARIINDYTRVRDTPSLDNLDNVVTMYRTDQIVAVVGYDGEFVQIETDAASVGYVHMSCLEIWKEFDTALTLEEEAYLNELQRQREEAYQRALEELLAQQAYESSVAESQSIEYSLWESASIEAYNQSVYASQLQAQQEYEAYLAASKAQAEAEYQASVLASMQATTAPPAPADPNAALRNAVVAFALQFVGCPYVHGGRSLSGGTDCSGFTNMVYQQFNYNLSWTVEGTAVLGTKIPFDQALPGDLLFYANSTSPMGHVAMYIGNGQIVHAASPAFGICIWNMMYRTPLFAVRIIP